MQQADDLARKSLQTAADQHLKILRSPREMLSMKLINQLFVRLQSNYGNKFSSQYATEQLLEAAKKEWAFALSPFNADDFSYAIREMQKHYKEWPPTPGQFIELCRKHYKTMPLLDAPKVEVSNKAIGNAAIAKIREMIGVNKVNDEKN